MKYAFMKDRNELYIKNIKKHYTEMQKELDEIDDNYDNFINDYVIRKAITFDLMQIGELFGNLSDDVRKTVNQSDIRGIKDVRNFIVHGYCQISNEEIWKTIHDDLPYLISVLP